MGVLLDTNARGYLTRRAHTRLPALPRPKDVTGGCLCDESVARECSLRCCCLLQRGGGHLVCLMDHFVNALLGDLFQLGALGEYVSTFLHNL